MRYTKIVSTIGPATSTEETLEELVEAGVDVARLNFSHVDHEQHRKVYETIRRVSEDIAIMADTKGPEIRLGEVEEDSFLIKDEKVELTVEEQEGNSETLYVNYEDFPKYLEEGDRVLIDDGKIELEVEKVGETVECLIVQGGEVSDRKAVNIPGKDVGLQAPTEKDRKDIRFAAEQGFDFLALSFVKEASDVEEAREIIEEHDGEMDIISKIEHPRAVENYEEILEASDAIMVARGDLGVEMPAAKLPMFQKEFIEKANQAGKPVITATQMLESMIENPLATRAEISDVANAVLDGTDAVMLSGETAIGDHPVKTVEFMAEVVGKAEETVKGKVHHTVKGSSSSTSDIISKNVWQASRDSDAKFIVAHTVSGGTARNIAKYRPETPIMAFTNSKKVSRQLRLVWGVHPVTNDSPQEIDLMIQNSAETLLERGMVKEDDKLVLSAGMPIGVPGTTNMMQIRTVESLL